MLLAAMSQYLFGIAIFVTSFFLVLLVLVQRGRGGGLTGALGGPGGQSAFGTKAGDLFTKITVFVATFWIFLCASAVFFLKSPALPSTGLAEEPSSMNATADETGDAVMGGLDATGLTDDATMSPAVDPANLSPADAKAGAEDFSGESPTPDDDTPSSDETPTADADDTTNSNQ